MFSNSFQLDWNHSSSTSIGGNTGKEISITHALSFSSVYNVTVSIFAGGSCYGVVEGLTTTGCTFFVRTATTSSQSGISVYFLVTGR